VHTMKWNVDQTSKQQHHSMRQQAPSVSLRESTRSGISKIFLLLSFLLVDQTGAFSVLSRDSRMRSLAQIARLHSATTGTGSGTTRLTAAARRTSGSSSVSALNFQRQYSTPTIQRPLDNNNNFRQQSTRRFMAPTPVVTTSGSSDSDSTTRSTLENDDKYTLYEKWVRRIYMTNMFNPVKLGLENMHKIHELLGSPMDSVRFLLFVCWFIKMLIQNPHSKCFVFHFVSIL
jgi:hypothetical protein